MYDEIMKKLAFLLLGFVIIMLMMPLALLMAPARADTSACYNIPDADGRTACIARERRDRSMCYAIQRSDMRALCLTEVRK